MIGSLEDSIQRQNNISSFWGQLRSNEVNVLVLFAAGVVMLKSTSMTYQRWCFIKCSKLRHICAYDKIIKKLRAQARQNLHNKTWNIKEGQLLCYFPINCSLGLCFHPLILSICKECLHHLVKHRNKSDGWIQLSIRQGGWSIVPYSENKIYQLAGGPTSDSTKPGIGFGLAWPEPWLWVH